MRRQIILYMLLLAALAFAVYTYWPLMSPYFSGLIKEKPDKAKLEEVKPIEPAGAVEEKKEEGKKARGAEKIPQKAVKKLVDPFSLRIAVITKEELKKAEETEEKPEVEKPKGPKLEGIWVDRILRVAFISGQALIEGGTVMGWRVKRITKTYVLLVRKGETKKLTME